MSILSGFKKYKNYKTDANGDHQLQSFWTSSDTVEDKVTEASTRTNLADGETLTTSLGKIKKYFSDLGTSAFKNTTDTYSGTGTDPVTGKAVKEAIDTLDVSEVGGTNKFIKAISEADGKISATEGTVDTTVTSGSSNLITSGAVYTAIDNLPEPMIFKGSLGTGGTITTLPAASSGNEGFTYKVITAGTYASQAAKVGDLFISNGSEWVWVPSGDEPSGTVTNVATGTGLTGGPITSTGTISHADTSSQASSTNSGRTYIQSVELDGMGHVTSLSTATETVTNTDRYVNSASFAHDSTNDNVKMTLTRAGSDTATVTGNIPAVSSSSAGVAPKGAAVTTQSQSTKFLREDGSWATPSYTGVKGDSETNYRTGNVNITKANIGLGNVDNTADANKSVASATTATTASKLSNTSKVGDTNKPVYFTANGVPAAISYTIDKSVPSDAKFTDTTYSDATTSASGLMSSTDKTKLNGIASGAEVNQNAFSNVKVGTSTVAADGKTDTLELIAGSNITLTPDTTNDAVTITATDTTYNEATTSAAGLMSSSDKTKLNGISTGAEVNQNAFSNVKVGSTTVAADAKTDTLELAAGSNITLTPDATNDKVTIAATDTNTTYTFATGDSNGQIKVTPSGGSAQNVSVKGLGDAAYKSVTTSVTSGSADLVTSGAVASAIDAMPEPMIFKGTLGTDGTITTLPTAAKANEGHTYKVITAGTYASQAAKVGDMFVSAKPEGASSYSWVYIPSGDDAGTDTWRNIKVNGTEKLGTAITTGGVDFVNGTNTTVSFNTTGNKISISATDTNTHRPINVNGTQTLGDNTTALNLKNGSNVSITSSGGDVTISATDTTYSEASTTAAGLMSTSDKTKLNGIATGAEVNQNAFSNVKVGSTTVQADAKTDTLEFVAGSNVTITSDATNDKITIAATDTTYSDATTSASGLMSSTDKTKLNGIASGAEVNVQSDWNVTDSSSDSYIKNKPTIPAAQVNSDWNASSGVAQILNKPTLGDLASIDIDGVSSTKFLKGDGTWDSVSGGDVTGVKGDAESTYRTGNVNITAANVGALALSGGTMTGDIVMKSAKKIIPESGYNCFLGSTSKPFNSIASAFYNFCNTLGSGYGTLNCTQLSADRNWYLPDADGTLATREWVASNVKVQYNSFTTSGNSGWEYKTITFSTEYKSVPLISVMCNMGATAPNNDFMIDNYSTTGFRFGRYAKTSGQRYVWFAVGVV